MSACLARNWWAVGLRGDCRPDENDAGHSQVRGAFKHQ
jgi:hypothetical protein